ncbi:threonine ammonia-lyase [Rhodohalobacter sp. 8-1]|uniref:threonine ammonia-lyase n=1 Tax=Rhodohalobacter sp. 8-1 TaxID=3131972 RepID=UPI0030EDACF2
MGNNSPVLPSYTDVEAAVIRISPFANHTPVLTSRTLNEQTGGEIYFKCENFQRAGAFKFRGACNAVYSLSESDASAGVATHSSGNHGQALALAAKMRGIPAYVVMPENSPTVKLNAVKGYGAKVIRCESNQKAREETLRDVIDDTGAHFIHPYDDEQVIAGQGTCAHELLMDHPGLDIIMAPVGGGGLISGTAITAKQLMPNIQVIGTEPEKADDAYQSLKSGTLQQFDTTQTVADGLRTTLSERTFSIIKENVDDILTVSDESIILAMRTIWERMNIIIETSCSVPVAAILEKKINIDGQKVGVILTGGNVDLDHLPWQK